MFLVAAQTNTAVKKKMNISPCRKPRVSWSLHRVLAPLRGPSLSDARRRGSAGGRTAQGIVAARKGRPRERVRGREREGVERRSEHK